MVAFQASSGSFDVVAYGTVIAFQGNPIEILFDALPEPLDLTPDVPTSTQREQNQRPLSFPTTRGPRFKLIFRFTDEPTLAGSPAPASRILTERVPGQLVMNITLFNFTSALGSGNTKPIGFGYAGDRTLHLQYRVFGLGGGADKTLQFTVFQSRERDHQTKAEAKGEAKNQANG